MRDPASKCIVVLRTGQWGECLLHRIQMPRTHANARWMWLSSHNSRAQTVENWLQTSRGSQLWVHREAWLSANGREHGGRPPTLVSSLPMHAHTDKQALHTYARTQTQTHEKTKGGQLKNTPQSWPLASMCIHTQTPTLLHPRVYWRLVHIVHLVPLL